MTNRARWFLVGTLVLVLASALACAPMPVARLILGKESVSPAQPGTASIWGRVEAYEECLLFDPPLVVLLKGPGLPPEGARSLPQDPSSERGAFRFVGLSPGRYRLSLAAPRGFCTSAECKSSGCFSEVRFEPGEVVVELGEGESKEVQVGLVWVKNGPDRSLASPPRFPMIDRRDTSAGATIPDTMFQNIPLGPPADR